MDTDNVLATSPRFYLCASVSICVPMILCQSFDFDRRESGETFSGLEYRAGLAAVEALKPIVPAGMSLGQMAIAWIQSNPAVTCSIPGCRNTSQVDENVSAADVPDLGTDVLQAVAGIYQRHAKPLVHDRW